MAQIMRKRVYLARTHVGIRQEIKIGLKIGARIAAFTISLRRVMEERVHAGMANIFILLQIPARIEDGFGR